MARQPKPWFRADRKVWCVTITGKRHNLGRNKKEAFKKFYRLCVWADSTEDGTS